MVPLFVAASLGLVVLVGATRWRTLFRNEPAASAAPAASPQDREAATFRLCHYRYYPDCVVDGDTIRYRNEKIRIADINAPEVSEPQCDRELDLGEAAADRLLALLNQGRFTLRP